MRNSKLLRRNRATYQGGYVVGHFALGKMPYVRKFDALISRGKPIFLALRGFGKVDAIRQTATEKRRHLDQRQRLPIELRLLPDVAGAPGLFP